MEHLGWRQHSAIAEYCERSRMRSPIRRIGRSLPLRNFAFVGNSVKQSAAEHAEDLRCELDHLPLKHAPNSSLTERLSKWRRRHPRMLSVTTLVMTLVVVLAVSGVRWLVVRDRMATMHAQSQWQDFRLSAPAVRTMLSAADTSPQALDEGLAAANLLVNQYHVEAGRDWTQSSDVLRISQAQ